ncbi:MAG: HipA domain-containing protein [Saccharofermentanales bacterium]|jgi:hypothetical protein
MVDFTNYEINIFRGYGGKNGSKIAIVIDGENYMLKIPPAAKNNPEMSYSNSSISEHIGCNIFNLLGVEAQKTILGKFNDKLAVACKDFNTDNYQLMEFALLKNQIIDSSGHGYGVELSEILETIKSQSLIPQEELMSHFWDIFIVDALIGNFDRHNGNWGLLINERHQIAKVAPIYDCGSCLYPQLTDQNMKDILNDQKEIENRIFVFPNSILRENNVKINYYNFLTTTNNSDCIEALGRIGQRIDLSAINYLIDDTPYISGIYKTFLKTIIQERKEKILDKAIEIHKINFKSNDSIDMEYER